FGVVTGVSSVFRASIPHAGGAELAFKFPGLAVRIERFAEPMKRIIRDFREGPTRRRAVRTRADLNDILPAATADLVLVVVARGVAPADAPSVDRRVPDAQRAAIHIHVFFQPARSIRTSRHDPDILHRTAFK